MMALLLDPATLIVLALIVLALIVDYIRDHRRGDTGNFDVEMFDGATIIKVFRIAEGKE